MQSAWGSVRASDGWCEQAVGPPLGSGRTRCLLGRDELAACLNPKVGKLAVN